MRKRVLVIGAGLAGLTTALSVKRDLGGDVDVTVVAPRAEFLFTPSLIGLPFAQRGRADISFPVAPTLHEHDIAFVHAAALAVDPVARLVSIGHRRVLCYDYLVVATGSRDDEDAVPGFTTNACTITSLAAAERAQVAWRRFREEPGDVVVAAARGAGCPGAAYEFLFGAAVELRRLDLRGKVRLTLVTAEPSLAHLGVGRLPQGDELLDRFLRRQGVDLHLGAAVDRVDPGSLVLGSGDELPFAFAMVVPPFLGQELLAGAGLTDDRGFVPVRPTYQSEKYDEIYAVGTAAAVSAPWQTPVPVGVPRTGFPVQEMARTAARNIASQVRGEPVLADTTLPPLRHGVLVPGPQAHWMKLGFEKYYLWKMQHGFARLP